MPRRYLATLASLLLLTSFLASAAAHAPEFPSGNESIEQANEIHDPTKSWAIYSELHEGGEAHYYMLSMKQGENITVSLTAPRSATDKGFLPSVALMGPGIMGNDPLPSYVTVPEGSGVLSEAGMIPSELEYEPFSPSAFYMLAEIELEAPQDGDYYLAVFDDNVGGNYGLAVGLRESFTVEEWLLIPFSALSIYQWEGQSLLTILAPGAITFIAGLAIMTLAARRRPRPVDLLWAMATVAGVLMIASGASLLYQMLWALSQTGTEPTLVVTIIFAIVPLALGSAALRIAHRDRPSGGVKAGTRLALLAIGALGLLLWAGWVAGPAITILAAVLPSKWLIQRLTRK